MWEKPKNGIVVDAATSGNPGLSKYRGMDLGTGEIVFEKIIGYATNNIAEFLALVHGIAYCKKNNKELIVYSDSMTAISWVSKCSVNSSLKKTPKTELALNLIPRAIKWLKENEITKDLDYTKWETHIWGEIPSDYGNK